ncbi:hypothetical protein N1031_15770 [Herbiconiux moechotypicola]|uniref:Uncharacterized protein n=1 Tax=Herbiconiux moechotypicola TaxID=637393 RepID=A0ABN3DYT6_9MICO|nr:hypothetical protein [Herbiconiux moechotypicola]MCS5731223.1 hypothetical protein [Herbiconiux moechotypicola]
MRSEPRESDDELPWDLDLTVARRPEPVPVPAPVPAPTPSTPRAPHGSRKGRFHRPDLESPWQHFTRNLAVRILAAVLLVGGTAALVYVAVTR